MRSPARRRLLTVCESGLLRMNQRHPQSRHTPHGGSEKTVFLTVSPRRPPCRVCGRAPTSEAASWPYLGARGPPLAEPVGRTLCAIAIGVCVLKTYHIARGDTRAVCVVCVCVWRAVSCVCVGVGAAQKRLFMIGY